MIVFVSVPSQSARVVSVRYRCSRRFAGVSCHKKVFIPVRLLLTTPRVHLVNSYHGTGLGPAKCVLFVRNTSHSHNSTSIGEVAGGSSTAYSSVHYENRLDKFDRHQKLCIYIYHIWEGPWEGELKFPILAISSLWHHVRQFQRLKMITAHWQCEHLLSQESHPSCSDLPDYISKKYQLYLPQSPRDSVA